MEIFRGLSSVMFSVLLFIDLIINIFGVLSIIRNSANLELVGLDVKRDCPNVYRSSDSSNLNFLNKFAVWVRNIGLVYLAVCLFSFLNLTFGNNIGIIINFRIFILGIIIGVIEGITGFSLRRQYQKIIKLRKSR